MAEKKSAKGGSASGRKILIVEDDKPLIKALSSKLEKSGFEVIVAGNGEEGLTQISSQKPDLVLLDIVMPLMDGLIMLKELRKTSEVPVVMLTNLSDDAKLSEALESGSHDYLVKSDYSLDDVIEKINEILSR